MATETSIGAILELKDSQRDSLGKDFLQWVGQVEDDRRQLILETYNRVQENLDGRAPVKSFPWLGASNAFAPLTGTYADALQSRLFDAATAHDPTNLVLPRGAGNILEDLALGVEVGYERWADWWQRISRWAERDDIDYKSLMEMVTLQMTHFGDSWVYLPWEEQWMTQIDVLKGGKLKKTPRLLYARPMPKVLHPKDVFCRWDALDHQLERLIGFQFDLDLPTLDEWEAKGVYDKDVAAELRKKLTTKRSEADRQDAEYRTGYFRQLGTRVYNPDEFEEKQKAQMKLAAESGNRSLKMVKMFARVDMDGDGTPEDTIYDVEKESGLVPSARYSNYAHRERPLLHYWFKKRPGAIYNIGVGEMMLNIQDIINTGLRDHFDNNKIQNTSVMLFRKNSGIKKGKKFYPSASYWVNDPANDVKTLELGHGKSATTLQEVGLLERWGQYVVGLSDFQLGEEPKSRTPATTAMAGLQEANIRPKRVIEVMRNTMRKMHRQILVLYAQNGDPAKLAQVAAVEVEDRELFQKALAAIPLDAMADSLVIDPDVSSDSLNRQARRQEALALDAQNNDFWMRINNLMNLIGGALQDPIAKAIYLAQAAGYLRLYKRVLDTFEERDQREILPDALIKLLEGVTSVEANAPGAGGEAAVGSSPAEASQGLVTQEGPAAGPVAPEGRPGAGQSRPPIANPANGGDNG